uniref:Glycosyltransferase n=1 Tax=Rubia yunnanensis TaxID=1650721 RepID=A0A896AHU4_9GENT|nr:glycosyltransferase [Rubia yunnanensis]
MAKPRAQKHTVILVPFPYQGHITPMLQLGALLHSQGFSVIVAHPDFNSPDPLNHPQFDFLPLDAGLSGMDTSFENVLAIISAFNRNCRAALVDFLVPMMKDEAKYGKISCIIYDVITSFGNTVADHFKIPSLVLSTCNAVYMQVLHTILQLQAQNQIPLPESRLLDQVPQLHALRYKDMGIPVTNKINNEVVEFLAMVTDLGSSVGVIWNSSDILDGIALSQLKKHYKLPFFPIGPFHKMAATSSTTSYIKEDRSCIAWLEKQSYNSVLYISLGSLAEIKAKELEETAWGLAGSGLPFLWVIRPGSVTGTEWTELLPKGFPEAVAGRGCIVKWAPQKEVLAHSSVGGFLSHCGWNSTLESISEGVPMICRPYFADQLANMRYITHVWNVGLELEEVENRGVIESIVTRVMVGDEGKDIRQRMLALKKCLDDSTQKGGSSYQCLNDLTDFICSFP